MPEDASSNADAARMMHLAIVAAEPYQHTPLRELQAACQTRGAFSGFFDTLFVFQNMGRETTEGVEPLLWHPEPLQSETDEPEVSFESWHRFFMLSDILLLVPA